MEQILPLVKKYDAAVIALPNDVDEIPMEPDKRLALVEKIVRVATTEYGIAHRGHRDRPAGDADRRRRHQRPRDAGDHAPDPRHLRAEHDLRLLQRLLRHARSARAQRHLPEHGDDRGPDQRDHGHPYAGGGLRGQGDRPAAGSRRVGDGLDLPAPAARRQSRRHRQRRRPRARDGPTGGLGTSLAGQHRARGADGPARNHARRPRRQRSGAAVVHRRRAGRTATCGCRPASPSSTRRRGTASRSTPPVAATAPATSARSGSTLRCRSRATTGKTFSQSELAGGWRLACLATATQDLKVDVPPLTTRPKAATVGVGRQVILRPAVQKRYVELADPTLRTSAPTWSG